MRRCSLCNRFLSIDYQGECDEPDLNILRSFDRRKSENERVR